MIKKKCLVTGGAGFIGSHLAECLVKQGHDVTVLDNFYREKPSFSIDPKIKIIEGSVVDEGKVEAIVSKHEIVFHMAAILGVRTTVSHPAEMIENNFLGTKNVLRSALRAGSKVIFASTSEVYGKAQPPFTENMNILYGPTRKLRWSYGIGKALEESLCLAYAQKGLRLTILRYFNIYGPRQKEGPYGGVIPRFIRAALKNGDIPVYGDGEQTRCFTYIDDAVEATVKAMEKKADREIINIGTREETKINTLASLIKKLSQSHSSITHIPFEKVYPDEFEEIYNRIPDSSKAEKYLQFEAKTSLGEGLLKTIRWYKNYLA